MCRASAAIQLRMATSTSSKPAGNSVAGRGTTIGERAIAAVTLREDHRRTEDAVKAFARASLADYKVPSAVVFDLGPFPRNATGKVDKAKLRAAYLERLTELA